MKDARRFTLGIEEEFQVIDPETRELRSHVAEIFARGQAGAEGAAQARAAPVGDRGRHADLPRHRRTRAARSSDSARSTHRPAPAKNGLRIAAAGTHPFSHWADVGITPERALRADRLRSADGGAGEPHLRPARARRGRGSRDADPDHEPGALLPAAHPGAVRELAVLAGARHRMDVVSLQGVRQVPAHEHPGLLRLVRRVRVRSCKLLLEDATAIKDRQADLVGHPAALPTMPRSSSGSATSRCAPRRRSPSPRSSRRITAKLWSCCDQNLGFRLYRRALIMENKWRAARWGHRGEAHRLRQGGGGSARRPRSRRSWSSWTTSWTSWAAAHAGGERALDLAHGHGRRAPARGLPATPETSGR